MFGFILGTVCLVALVKVLRHGRGFGYGGWHGGYGYGGGWQGRGCGGGWHSRGFGGPPWARGGWYRNDAFGHGDHHDHGEHDRGGWDGPGFGGMRSSFLNGLFRRLDTTPGQEKEIAAAFEELREAMQKGRDSMREFRGQVATAVRGEQFDAEHMGEAYAKQDDAIETMRKAFVGALAKVHEVLDPRQRAIVADFLDSRGFGFRGFGRA